MAYMLDSQYPPMMMIFDCCITLACDDLFVVKSPALVHPLSSYRAMVVTLPPSGVHPPIMYAAVAVDEVEYPKILKMISSKSMPITMTLIFVKFLC